MQRFVEAEILPQAASVGLSMSALDKLKSVLGRIFSPNRPQQRAREMRADKENGTYRGQRAFKSNNFETDYNAAYHSLKQRMNANFPDNYYAKLASRSNNLYDYGADRALAVDKVSTAIAAALRDGATIQQAADAGAASVGI